ncbi:hypothetical protein RFI_25328, partial [Reticulomyxa filosa]
MGSFCTTTNNQVQEGPSSNVRRVQSEVKNTDKQLKRQSSSSRGTAVESGKEVESWDNIGTSSTEKVLASGQAAEVVGTKASTVPLIRDALPPHTPTPTLTQVGTMLDQDASIDSSFIVCVYTSNLSLSLFPNKQKKKKKKRFEDDIEVSQRRDSNEKIDIATNNEEEEEEEEKLNETQVENENKNRSEDLVVDANEIDQKQKTIDTSELPQIQKALEDNTVIRAEATDNGLAVAVAALPQTLEVTPIEHVSPLLQVDAEYVATIQQKYQAKLTATFAHQPELVLRFVLGYAHEKPKKRMSVTCEALEKYMDTYEKLKLADIVASEMSEDEKKVHECWTAYIYGIDRMGHPIMYDQLGSLDLTSLQTIYTNNPAAIKLAKYRIMTKF